MYAIRRGLRRADGLIRCLFFPVSRKLTVCVLAYMAGIVCARRFFLPAVWSIVLAFALLAVCLISRKRYRKMLPGICALLFVMGNCACGMQLSVTDAPTPPKTAFSGTVARIESEYRVLLENVVLDDGRQTNRPVVVTLMNDDEAPKPEEPLCGQRITGVGRLFAQEGVRNPGGVDNRLRAICDGYELSGYLLPGWTAEGKEQFSLMEMFRRLRLRLSDHLELLFGDKAPFFAAILLGERGEIDKELAAAMRLTGTAHILSVSGIHLSIVSAALYALLSRIPVHRGVRYTLQVFGMVFFAGLTGFAVGTIRALVMSMLSLLASLRARRYEPLTALAASAFLITLYCPLMVFNAGFQFSFFVVLGIHLLREQIERMKPVRLLMLRFPSLCKTMVVSAAAQAAAIPMQLTLYGYIPLLSLPMNLLIGLSLPLLMIGGLIISGIGVLSSSMGQWIGGLVSCLVKVYEQVLLFAADIPGGVLRLPAPPWAILVLFGCVMALISAKIRFGKLRYAACAAIVLVIAAVYLPLFDPAARYVQLDVGQGDASLIRRGRKAVVVDVGPASSYDLLRYLRHEGLEVEAVILSHLDEDHAGALGVLLSYEVDIPRVIMAERAMEDVNSQTVMDAFALLDEKGISAETVCAGDVLSVMGLEYDVLAPSDAQTGSNERSLLLHVDVDGTSFLLAGDLPSGSEPETVPDCDVLKVAHHGSKNASTRAFLEQTSPEIALISVGRNSYGHPHERVLNDLNGIGANVYRTDENGCITVWLKDEPTVEAFLRQ